MTRRMLSLACVVLCGTVANAQATREKAAEEQARKACAAMVQGKFEDFTAYTHPKLVQALGGREKMVSMLKSGLEEIQGRGVTFVDAKVRTPGDIVAGGKELFAVVPYELQMKVPQGRLRRETWLLGISSDAGKNWTFIDGANLKPEGVKKMFPEFPAALKFPPAQQPVIEKTQPQPQP